MKRLLAFVVLLAAGIVALWLAIGDEAPVVARTGPETQEAARSRAGGVAVREGPIGVSVSQSGPLSFPQYRTVPLPGGAARSERVFVLDAEDSRPVDEALQQLDRVTVLLFERDEPVARLTAERAFLELNRDAAGKPSLREDKEIDLRGVVFESLPGARLEGVRLELENARVRIGEDDLQLRTANDTDPVLLVVAGENSGTLRGRGLQARLPRGQDSVLRRADVSILSEPVLESDGLVVRARGRMDYREDIDRREAVVTLDDRVELELQRAPGTSAAGAQIRGDRFTGWLLRSDDGAEPAPAAGGGASRGRAAWRRLLLTGAPATVDLPEGRLQTPRITVLPGFAGDPWLVTAHGGTSRFEQTQLLPGSRQTGLVTGTSARRLHLVRPGSGEGALLRAFGFPQWTLRPLAEQHVVVFEGASRLDDDVRTVEASDGLHLFHRERSAAVTARGFGDVRIEHRARGPGERDVSATGDDGFLLHATETARRLRLGPPRPGAAGSDEAATAWRAHHYTVRSGTAEATGTGAARLDVDGERVHIELQAPGAEIAGRLPEEDLALAGLRHLDLVLAGDEVQALAASGLPARLWQTTADGTAATAPRVERIGTRSLRLATAPAGDAAFAALAEADALPTVRRAVPTDDGRTATAVLRGPCIDLHHAGGTNVVVDAAEVDGVEPIVDVELFAAAGSAPTRAHCRAGRVRALPFAIAPEARLAHAAGTTGALSFATFHSAARPWLVVDGVREFHLVDPVHGDVRGHGERLVLSQGAEAGLFVGDADGSAPAEVRHEHDGRVTTATGARVRVFRDEALRLVALPTFEDRPAFLLPTVTLRERGSTGPLSHMLAVSHGTIDVLPDRIEFGGPVHAHGLDDAGAADPGGLSIDARSLVMRRDPDTGAVASALGREVRLDSPTLAARAAEVEIDVAGTRCVARDPDGAVVTLPGGRTITAPWIQVDYETLAYRVRNGRMTQAVEAGAVRK